MAHCVAGGKEPDEVPVPCALQQRVGLMLVQSHAKNNAKEHCAGSRYGAFSPCLALSLSLSLSPIVRNSDQPLPDFLAGWLAAWWGWLAAWLGGWRSGWLAGWLNKERGSSHKTSLGVLAINMMLPANSHELPAMTFLTHQPPNFGPSEFLRLGLKPVFAFLDASGWAL